MRSPSNTICPERHGNKPISVRSRLSVSRAPARGRRGLGRPLPRRLPALGGQGGPPGRVVAVGTTVTRALETVAQIDGWVFPGAGWTNLVLGADRPARVVDGARGAQFLDSVAALVEEPAGLVDR